MSFDPSIFDLTAQVHLLLIETYLVKVRHSRVRSVQQQPGQAANQGVALRSVLGRGGSTTGGVDARQLLD